MPLVKRQTEKRNVDVIWYNVDTKQKLDQAEKVIAEQALPRAYCVAIGEARQDKVWRMLGSMQGLTLAAGLEVLIDAKGVVRHASAGYREKELKAALEEWTKGS